MSREEQVINALLDWHKENRRRFPWRDEKDPYKVLVAEFLLQRTPAQRVAEVYPAFITKYPSPRELATANVSDLVKEYRRLGLVKRFSWLVESMKIVRDQHSGSIPDSKILLKKLPGIGEYTASAILCFAFKEPIEIIDTNVYRIYSRIFNISKKDIQFLAKEIFPKNKAKIFNEALLDFSAIICLKNPKCNICPINKICKKYIENN